MPFSGSSGNWNPRERRAPGLWIRVDCARALVSWLLPPLPEPPRQIPDPAKTEAEAAVLVRWRDSEEGGCRWEPHTGRLGDLVTFQSSFSAEGPLFSVALGLVELYEGLPGSGGQGPSTGNQALQFQEGLICCRILPSSHGSTRVQPWDPGLSDFRDVTAAEAFLCFSFAFNFYFILESSWLKKRLCLFWVYSSLIQLYIYILFFFRLFLHIGY